MTTYSWGSDTVSEASLSASLALDTGYSYEALDSFYLMYEYILGETRTDSLPLPESTDGSATIVNEEGTDVAPSWVILDLVSDEMTVSIPADLTQISTTFTLNSTINSNVYTYDVEIKV